MTSPIKVARPGPRDRAWSLFVYVCLACALVLAAVVGLRMFGNAADVAQGQQHLQDQFSVSDGESVGVAAAAAFVKPPEPVPGNVLARITVPTLGQHWYVVEGVNPADIVTAPGHYPGTALPGQRGNFAVAGHREVGLFWDLDRIRQGDEITVQTRQRTFTYVVTRNFITSPQSWPEVSATPPGFQPGSRVLTLTTCDPKWDNYHRLVVHAVLES